MKRYLFILLALIVIGPMKARAATSSGNYRIPYTDNIDVQCLQDATTHFFPNRVEIKGIDIAVTNYAIRAAAAGTVRRIRDAVGGTNYVWIQHSNGEWSGYFYLRAGSIIGANVQPGDSVTNGQFLGFEGSVGSPLGPRMRFEIGVPTDPSDPIVATTGMIKGESRIPIVCNIPGNQFVKNGQYTATDCVSMEFSHGVYRLPYSNTVHVNLSFDHLTHMPPKTRLDMSGVGGNFDAYPIAASAAGTIMAIMDTNTITCTSNDSCSDYNNYVWIRHDNGEWTKYSHFVTGTVRGKANLVVGQHVEAGRYLGDEGQVGFAFGIHCHFEVAVPYNGHLYTNAFQPDLTNAFGIKGGFINGIRRIPLFCNIPGNVGYAGNVYTAGSCLGGACVNDITLPAQFIRGTDAHIAANTVDTGGNSVGVDTYASLALYAGNKVTLRPGFHAGFNSYVRAAVQPCINTSP
jgi:murein DD-endopeptidase MepM/ murein hydrolase activator NlpD